jgi:nucleoid DNA-binding protein
VRFKSEIDHRVAIALGIPYKRVALVTDTFVEELNNAIVEANGFHLIGLGKLVVRFEGGSLNVMPEGTTAPMRIKLYFTKSLLLKEQIERKYGIFKEAPWKKKAKA